MKGKIFNAQEVQAMLNGSKVMFRELVNTKQSFIEPNEPYGKCPYKVGQKIFCKETFSYSNQPWCDKTIFYKASHGDRIQHTFSVSQRENKWRSPMVMQEYDSRLTLLIKSIGVERLKDLSGEDAIKEGFNYGTNLELSQLRFFENWNATHKKPEQKFKFEASPWVWVVSLEIINN